MNKLNLTWREVFDSYQSPIHDIENMLKLLKTTGYKYFDWNGLVYKVSEDYKNCRETGLTVEDL